MIFILVMLMLNLALGKEGVGIDSWALQEQECRKVHLYFQVIQNTRVALGILDG